MSDEPEMIRRQMQATRGSLAEKIETLEQRVVGTVSDAQAAVAETVGTVKDTVQETVATVKGSVQDTVDTVRDAFDLRAHVDRHPYASMGMAVAAGFVIGRLLEGGERPRDRPFGLMGEPASNGHTYAAPRHTPVDAETTRGLAAGPRREPGWLDGLAGQFGPELDKLKAMAIGTGLGLLRDLLAPSVPQHLRPGVNELVDRVTTKLGGESFREGAFRHA